MQQESKPRISNGARLLIAAQAVDQGDAALGFFLRWIEELAKHYERIEVIALKVGHYSLPKNVRVHSLGKEKGRPALGALTYGARLIAYAWHLRNEYDLVFVHQGQEHILGAGWLWKLLRKPIYMWRNHYQGSFLTDIAASFCTKVFCTSRVSYTAEYKHTVLMPVGLDVERFSAHAHRVPNSVLYLARFAPSKKPHLLVEALGLLNARGLACTASFHGPTDPKDFSYRETVIARARELGLEECVTFEGGIQHEDAPHVFASHEVYVNLMGGGAYDKTIFEAAASGCLVLAASPDFADLTGTPALSEEPAVVAQRIEELFTMRESEKQERRQYLRHLVEEHDLPALAKRLAEEMRY